MASVLPHNTVQPSESRSLGLAVALIAGLLLVAAIASPASWLQNLAGDLSHGSNKEVVIQQVGPTTPIVRRTVTVCSNPYIGSAEGPCNNR